MNVELNDMILKEALALSVRKINAMLPAEEECAEITFSPGFEKRMDRMIRDHEKFYYFWFNTIAKRVASVVLLVVLGLAVTTFSVKAWRESLIRFVVEFFETFAIVNVEHENVSVPSTLTPIEPAYIPEGFCEESRIEDEVALSIKYCDYMEKMIVYRQSVISDSEVNIDIEEVEYQSITIQGYEGALRSKCGQTAIIFATEKYVFSVKGTLDEAEIILIAESIPLE